LAAGLARRIDVMAATPDPPAPAADAVPAAVLAPALATTSALHRAHGGLVALLREIASAHEGSTAPARVLVDAPPSAQPEGAWLGGTGTRLASDGGAQTPTDGGDAAEMRAALADTDEITALNRAAPILSRMLQAGDGTRLGAEAEGAQAAPAPLPVEKQAEVLVLPAHRPVPADARASVPGLHSEVAIARVGELLISVVVSATLALIGGYLLFAPTWEGTFANFALAFTWAFGVDLTVQALTQYLPTAPKPAA
jgi:hypothetical protein